MVTPPALFPCFDNSSRAMIRSRLVKTIGTIHGSGGSLLRRRQARTPPSLFSPQRHSGLAPDWTCISRLPDPRLSGLASHFRECFSGQHYNGRFCCKLNRHRNRQYYGRPDRRLSRQPVCRRTRCTHSHGEPLQVYSGRRGQYDCERHIWSHQSCLDRFRELGGIQIDLADMVAGGHGRRSRRRSGLADLERAATG